MRVLIGVFIVLAIVFFGGMAAINNPAVQDRLVERAAQNLLGAAGERWNEADGLTVYICGSGSPLPSRKRAQPCAAVVAGKQFFLVDVGTGSWENIQLAQLPTESLGGVFLTHFHSDHIGDLGEANLISWVTGRTGPLSVYGPSGIEAVVQGLGTAYAQDDAYRTAHHGESVAPPRTAGMVAIAFEQPSESEETIVFEKDGLRVIAFAVDHDPVDPAVGYRFERDGRMVVISGDTAPSKNLQAAAQGADLLVHEAQANHMVAIMQREAAEAEDSLLAKILSDIPDYHTSPAQAAEIANAAGVNLLVLTHLTPAPDNAIAKKAFMRGVSKVRPRNVVLAEDGLTVRLPADGGAEVIEP